jgi:hypothetical protein
MAPLAPQHSTSGRHGACTTSQPRADLDEFRLITIAALSRRVSQLAEGVPNVLPTLGPVLKLCWWDLAFGLAVTASNIFNCFYICWAFSRVPAQDADVPFNFMQRARIYFEFVLLSAIPLWMMLLDLISSPGRPDESMSGTHKLGRWFSVPVQLLDMFSINALTLLAFACPPNMIRQARIMRFQMDSMLPPRTGVLRFAALGTFLLVLAVSAVVGVLALVFKLSQIAFIGSTSASLWTAGQWLALAAFTNNMVALSNREAALLQHTRTLLYAPYMYRDSNAVNLDFYLLGLLIQQYSMRGFLWYITLSGDKLAALFMDPPSAIKIPADSSTVVKDQADIEAARHLSESMEPPMTQHYDM